jgi:uncharacterized protein YeaO (DUF488 family)
LTPLDEVIMAIRVVRLGTARATGEGLRLGTVRRPPRGVRKEDYSRRDYFDVWLPELAPSAPLVSWALSEPFTPARWANYKRKYISEMRKAPAQRLIDLLAALSHQSDFSIRLLLRKRVKVPSLPVAESSR